MTPMQIPPKTIARCVAHADKRRMTLCRRSCLLAAFLLACVHVLPGRVRAQESNIRYGARISRDANLVYDRGLKYLQGAQREDGSWGRSQQNGITGLCLMAFLAGGEDPNFGRYRGNVLKALRSIIRSQNSSTGFIPNSMYHHGFATLALAEAYGAVDDSLLWEETRQGGRHRSIGAALELAVRCCITSQKKNKWGGWRYSPDSTDADTSVSGAVLVGLLAARNAGIEVPDRSIDKALKYFRNSTSDTGMVAYSGGIGGGGVSMNRSAVATLVYAVGKKKDWKEYEATLGHLTKRLEHQPGGYPYYFRYYMGQALFQGDFDAWSKWNRENTRILKEMQLDDGSFQSGHGPAYGTAMSLLSIALNYRFLPIYER
jgi:hypothetical protein